MMEEEHQHEGGQQPVKDGGAPIHKEAQSSEESPKTTTTVDPQQQRRSVSIATDDTKHMNEEEQQQLDEKNDEDNDQDKRPVKRNYSLDELAKMKQISSSNSSSNDNLDPTTAVDQLSLQEREEILYEIHGVLESAPETPELIETSLEQFQALVEKTETSGKLSDTELVSPTAVAAYHKALSISKDYVQNRSFLLAFLRADRFDVPRAVRRYMSFFEWKLELFGLSKLCKDITLQEDFDADDMQVMQNGALSVLPHRDRADRMVLCHVLSHQRYKDRISVVRSSYLCPVLFA
jgi:hypothetical protein